MADVKKSVLIERDAQRMFYLVDAVEDYPKFLPWCSGAELILRDETRTIATLHVNYHGIRTEFSTENQKQPPHHMKIKLRQGPFKHLDGFWNFKPLGDAACKIEFQLHYEFSSKLLEKVLGPVFHHIANSLIDAFVRRAEQVYSNDR